ncbi:MAG: EAL domain-containing protein [Myxococcota bacterium]
MATAKQFLAFVEHRVDDDDQPVRTALTTLPFRIGRGQPAELLIYSQRVSKLHAEIILHEGTYYVCDLGSRNGTFVNGDRVSRAELQNGDVIHVAHKELRFGLEPTSSVALDSTMAGNAAHQNDVIQGTRHLSRILTHGLVTAVFQPIFSIADRAVAGYEALGRNALPATDYTPGDLFRLATERGQAAPLSRLMRETALAASQGQMRNKMLFLNLHPAEMKESLEEVVAPVVAARDQAPGTAIQYVIEVHESAVTDLGKMKEIRDQFHRAGLLLAYDDFGAGQSRLMELAEVPPDVIKLDMGLIRGIDQSEGRQEVVRALIRVMSDLGVRVLAEGIETEEELRVCGELGCQLGQGFLLGRPQKVELLGH